ncbi:hypothetical protein [Streptomyces sp. NPDC002845]
MRHVREILSSAAELAGWESIGEPLVTTDRRACEGVIINGCPDAVAIGSMDLTRGGKTCDEWVRLNFTMYSCTSNDAARDVYAGLNLDGTELALPDSLGDERLATRQKLDSQMEGSHITLFSVKARTGTTVLWVSAVGYSELTATKERAQAVMQLLYDRTQQVKHGAKPVVSSSIG